VGQALAAEVSQGAEGAAEVGRGSREQAVKGRKRPQKSVCACDWGIAGCEEDGTGKRHTEGGGEGA
jgi:hypothetical protein